ncbi:hypothetical protein B9Z19DRAFT_991914 [Tuber borchii]|uniref:Uncharacterized protein n=1 Tax=Tuber borchii TaxID=42251 RepID=A0A2T6ZKW7_TUBBO|nr:hypothetical protein B9Z19DRAFT_991914 [Tuber borchii]
MPPRSIQTSLSRICRPCLYRIISNPSSLKRSLVIDHRNRISNFFVPTGGITYKKDSQMDVHSTLIRAGYIRQVTLFWVFSLSTSWSKSSRKSRATDR